VQLAAFPNEDDAHAAWRALKAAHPDAFAGLTPTFERADLGPKGVWVRLKVGPVASPEDARRTCAAAGVKALWCAREP
jgi:hypothetical protein